jgi:hypothetical protein
MAGIAGNELVLVVSDPVLTRLVGGQGGELAQPPVRLGRGAPRLLLAPGQPSDIKSRCRNRCFPQCCGSMKFCMDPDPGIHASD